MHNTKLIYQDSHSMQLHNLHKYNDTTLEQFILHAD